jgi:hypothetical protein
VSAVCTSSASNLSLVDLILVHVHRSALHTRISLACMVLEEVGNMQHQHRRAERPSRRSSLMMWIFSSIELAFRSASLNLIGPHEVLPPFHIEIRAIIVAYLMCMIMPSM